MVSIYIWMRNRVFWAVVRLNYMMVWKWSHNTLPEPVLEYSDQIRSNLNVDMLFQIQKIIFIELFFQILVHDLSEGNIDIIDILKRIYRYKNIEYRKGLSINLVVIFLTFQPPFLSWSFVYTKHNHGHWPPFPHKCPWSLWTTPKQYIPFNGNIGTSLVKNINTNINIQFWLCI